jgi:hypothetical protein
VENHKQRERSLLAGLLREIAVAVVPSWEAPAKIGCNVDM